MKPKEQIDRLIEILVEELKWLPSHDIFGDSNAESRAETEQILRELTQARNGVMPPSATETFRWLNGISSGLDDYGVV